MDALRDHPEVIYGAVAAFVIVILLTPAVGGMARLLGVVDRPESRRLNVNPIPRLGGIAIFFGIFVPALAFLELGRETRGVLLGAAVATVVGAIDDFRVLKPGRKLAGQIVAASIPPFFGVWIDHFTFPFFGPVDLPAVVGMPLTVLWIVAVMNMVNFLDGMDGLAAGVCAIAGITYAMLALSLEKIDPAILSAIVAGACIGFLRHNFFPARIFMGDSGALVLGFLLAAVSVQGLLKTASTVVLFLPLLVLAVPILDTSFVVARRLKHRQPRLVAGPGAPPLPLPPARVLAAAGRCDDVGVVRHPRRRGARDAVHPLPRGRPLAPAGDARRRRDRARRARLLALRRLRARDRQAEQSAPLLATRGARGRRPPLGLSLYKVACFPQNEAVFSCHKLLLCSPRRWSRQPTPNLSLAGAGSVLIGTTAAVIVIGILIGWLAGSTAWGFLIGAILGIPIGVFMTYKRYGHAL